MRKLGILGACAVTSFLILLLSEGLAEASNPCEKLKGNFAFRLVSVKSFSAESGTSGLAGAPHQDILRVGVLTIQGNCTLTATVRATVDDNNGLTRLVHFTWTGTASTPVGGLGELRVHPGTPSCFDSTAFTFSGGKPAVTCPTDVEGDEEYEYVIVKERGLELIQSDNAGGGGAKIFMTGRAQRAHKDDDDD